MTACRNASYPLSYSLPPIHRRLLSALGEALLLVVVVVVVLLLLLVPVLPGAGGL